MYVPKTYMENISIYLSRPSSPECFLTYGESCTLSVETTGYLKVEETPERI